MVKCSNCGTEVSDEAKFCNNCGSEIVVEEPVNDNGTKFCSNCGYEMPQATKFCPECGTPIDDDPQVVNTTTVVNGDKTGAFAAVLSFFIVGLGQVYLGLTKKGILLFFGAIVSGVLMLILIGWITWLLVWGYAIYDAYKSAEKMNMGIAVEDNMDIHNLFWW